MKNLFALFILSGLLFISCKKDRVCSCSVVTTGTTSTHAQSDLAGIDTTIVTPLNTTNNNDITFYKVSKRTAKTNCFNKEETVNETSVTGFTGLFTSTATNSGRRVYDCKLK